VWREFPTHRQEKIEEKRSRIMVPQEGVLRQILFFPNHIQVSPNGEYLIFLDVIVARYIGLWGAKKVVFP
jgi:hypothetical protein